MGDAGQSGDGAGSEQLWMLMVGAPGAGKGTIAKWLVRDFGFKAISSGDVLRAAARDGTLPDDVKAQMSTGELISDDVVAGLVAEALKGIDSEAGGILDGFPRNRSQAEALSATLDPIGIKLRLVVSMEVPEDVIVERIVNRRVHPASGRTYHLTFNPPKVDGQDDETGEPLITRSDDNEETVRERLRVFHEHSGPLIDFFEKDSEVMVLRAEGETSKAMYPKITDTVASLMSKL